jgi:hypothetical protein
MDAGKIASLKAFDGLTDAFNFIRQYKIVAVCQQWEVEKQIENISLFLDGKALRIYNTIMGGQTVPTTMAPIYKALMEGCACSSAMLLTAFHSRRKNRSESFAQFSANLSEFVSKVVLSNSNTAWDKVMDILDQCFPVEVQLTGGNPSKPTLDSIKIEPSESFHMGARVRTNNNNQQRFQGNCHFCNIFGHRMSECNAMAQSRNQQFGNKSFNSTGSSQNNSNSNNSYRQEQSSFQSTRNNNNNYNKSTNSNQYRNQATGYTNQNEQQQRPSYNNTQQQPYQAPNLSTVGNQVDSPIFNSTMQDNSFTNESVASHNNNDNRQPQQNHQNSHSNYIMVNSSSESYQEFPFHNAESFTINALQEASYGPSDNSAALMKTVVRFSVEGDDQYLDKALALVDGGSTHNFLSPKLLSSKILHKLSLNKKCQIMFSITSATGRVEELCYVICLNIKLNNWHGKSLFVVSHKAATHEMVLGRRFLKDNRVTIQHGSDLIIIDGLHEVYTNVTSASALSLPNMYMKTLPSLEAQHKKVSFKDPQIIKSVNNEAYISDRAIVRANTQMLVPVKCNSSVIATKLMIFDPQHPFPIGCLIGKSLHDRINEIYINVINASDVDVSLGKDLVIGHIASCLHEELIDLEAPVPNIMTNVLISDTLKGNSQNKNPILTESNVAKAIGNHLILKHSQMQIPMHHNTNLDSSNVLQFTPNKPFPRGCLVCTLVIPKAHSFIAENQVLGFVEAHTSAQNRVIIDYEHAPNDRTKTSSFLFSVSVVNNNDIIVKESPHSKQIVDDINSLKLGDKLSPEENSALKLVLQNNHDVFQWHDGPPGRTTLATHYIPTGDTLPILQKQYPIPTVAQEQLRAQVKDMLEKSIIRESSSSWRSPVLLIKKLDSNGTAQYRFCIDLRRVNEITAKDAYSLPRIDESADVLSGAKYFSSMDINRAFWQVPLAEEDKHKTGFMVEGRLYEFNVMPFGSMNAPATFQRLMDRVLSGMTWKQVLVYLDDVLAFASTFNSHCEILCEIFARLRRANLKLKPSKCSFGTDKVNYLGFTISRDGIQPAEAKVQALLKTDRPHSTKVLMSFLCSINYYRGEIPCYGELTADLYDMANQKRRFCVWNEKTQRDFDILRRALSKAPILAFPNFKLPFYLQSDASIRAIGGACLQMVDLWRPVMFFGRKLSKIERRYSTTERELLGLIYGYKICYHLVFGRTIVFMTDHQPLVTLVKLKEPFGRLGRLMQHLAGVDYTITYIPGRLNYLADFMSRAVAEDIDEEDSLSSSIEINSLQITSAFNWSLEQEKDSELVLVKSCIKSNKQDVDWLSIEPNGNKWLKERRELYIYSDILKHGTNQIVAPSHLRKTILQWHHDVPFAGHRGAETVLIALKLRYFWFGMYTDTIEYCKTCEKCQLFNYSNAHGKAPLKPVKVSRSGQIIGLDFIGPMRTSRSGNRYAIIGIDANDKFVMAAATKSFDALTSAIFLLNEVICKHGMVECILSDQAKNFEADLFKHLVTLLGAHKIRSSPFHPMGNGITERVNKVVKPALAKLVDDAGEDWDVYLPMAVNAYNTSFHSSIGITPFEAHFGRPAVSVADVILNNQLPADTDPKRLSKFTLATVENAQRIRRQLLITKEAAQEKYRLQYNQHLKYTQEKYAIGDYVKLINYICRVGHSKAFEPKFLGPFRVSKVISVDGDDISYEVTNDKGTRIVHYNRLERFYLRQGGSIVLGEFNDQTIQEYTLPDTLKDEISYFNCFDFKNFLSSKLKHRELDSAVDLVIENGASHVETSSSTTGDEIENEAQREMLENLIDQNQMPPLESSKTTSEDEQSNESGEEDLQAINNGDPDESVYNDADTTMQGATDTIIQGALLVVSEDNITTRSSRRNPHLLDNSVVALKPKQLCRGCSKLFVGLKIHQNKCALWQTLQRATDLSRRPTLNEDDSRSEED